MPAARVAESWRRHANLVWRTRTKGWISECAAWRYCRIRKAYARRARRNRLLCRRQLTDTPQSTTSSTGRPGRSRAGRFRGVRGNSEPRFLPSGQAARTGLGLELNVIAATIVGGASLSGGEGTILGTILGLLIIGVMRNGAMLMGVSPLVQEFMIGLVIVIAVGIDKWSTRRSA